MLLCMRFLSFLLIALTVGASETNNLITTHYVTNHIVSDGESKRGNVWYHTNIVSKVTRVNLKGKSLTNSVVEKTNIVQYTIQEKQIQ